MLDLIVSRHGIGASFYELPACFYTRNSELGEAFCAAYSHTQTGEFSGDSAIDTRVVSSRERV